MNTDVYDFDRKLKRILKRIKESTIIPKCNKKTIMEYYMIKKNNNRCKSTIFRDLNTLLKFSETIPKPFEKITLILVRINFIQTIIIGMSGFVTSLTISRFFGSSIERVVEKILSFFDRHLKLKNFILKLEFHQCLLVDEI